MAVVSEHIPNELQAQVDAALAWFNARQDDVFSVTGIVDAQLSIESGEPCVLRLVLCGGDSCQKHSFEVASTGAGYSVAFASDLFEPPGNALRPQAELDPPPGALRNWLESVIPQHAFTVLLFYRGFW